MPDHSYNEECNFTYIITVYITLRNTSIYCAQLHMFPTLEPEDRDRIY